MSPVVDVSELREKWCALCRRAGGVDGFEAAFEELCDRYAEPQRSHHALPHISYCLSECDIHGPKTDLEPRDLDYVRMGLWLHDSVYDPRCHDNEVRSAESAIDILRACGFIPGFCIRIAVLVRQTAGAAERISRDPLDAFLNDCDFAILGGSEEDFDEYERGIRREYHEGFVPAATFMEHRANFLEKLVDKALRRSIFGTPVMIEAYEAKARANIARSIARLRSGIILE